VYALESVTRRIRVDLATDEQVITSRALGVQERLGSLCQAVKSKSKSGLAMNWRYNYQCIIPSFCVMTCFLTRSQLINSRSLLVSALSVDSLAAKEAQELHTLSAALARTCSGARPLAGAYRSLSSCCRVMYGQQRTATNGYLCTDRPGTHMDSTGLPTQVPIGLPNGQLVLG